MDNQTEHIDDLIGKYLAGEASSEEVAFIKAWSQQSEDNQKYFAQIQTIFTRAASITEWQDFNTDAAWNKVKANLHKPKGKSVDFPSQSGLNFFWKIAASIILVAGVGFFVYKTTLKQDTAVKTIEVIANKTAVSDTLPNGSGVFLNKETKVAYTYNRKKRLHNVKLKGEAYFNVKHNEKEKFIIEADGVYIYDIGTSFNVKAYPGSNTVEVVVEEGEVMFYTKDNPGIHLRASGKGVYNKDTKSFTIDEPEANVLAYKTKFFIFSGTDLQTVAATLNEVYDKKIVLADNLKSCKLDVSFKNETFDEVVQVIAETLNLTVKTSGDTVRLEGEGCE